MPKKISLMVLLLITVLVISGCGNKTDNQPITDNNTSNNQNQEQNQGQEQNQEQNLEQTNDQTTEIINPSGTYSINELLSLNQPMKCTWKESITDGNEVTNIIFINGKRFYQDVTMGAMGHAYTISNGEYLYIWNDFNDAASKIKYTKVAASDEPIQEKTPDTTGLDQRRDFVCENWEADNTIFNPPPDKNFEDVTEEMGQAVKELPENSENYKQQTCDLCQKAPSQELIDECLKNMQCY